MCEDLGEGSVVTKFESITAGVAQLFERYSEAVIAGNSALWASLWDEKAVQLPPGEPAVFGRKAIEKRFRKRFSGVMREFTVITEEVRICGDLVFARGTILSSSNPILGGEIVFADSKFLTILGEDSDGTWRILRECCNSNLPVRGTFPPRNNLS